MILSSNKKEQFAQQIAKGVKPAAAYVAVGYAPGGARSGAARLLTNVDVSARIKELKETVAAGVVAAEIRKRSWRVLQLQGLLDDMLALRAARKILYAGQKGEGYEFQVKDALEEAAAIAEGCRPGREAQPITVNGELVPPPEYPKNFIHPGFPLGGESGMLVKDYRGKNADQEIWKFDSALVSKILDTCKQAAIEEGQWTEKRETSGGIGISETRRLLNEGRDRVAKLKEERDAAAAKAAAVAAGGKPALVKQG